MFCVVEDWWHGALGLYLPELVIVPQCILALVAAYSYATTREDAGTADGEEVSPSWFEGTRVGGGKRRRSNSTQLHRAGCRV